MSETTQWQDFLTSISDRNGMDIFYDPKYADWQSDATGFSDVTVIRPWWSKISAVAVCLQERRFLIGKILSRTEGWARYDDDDLCFDIRETNFWHGIRVQFWKRLFYVAKAIACVVFLYNRANPKGLKYYDTVEVATYGFHPYVGEYTGTEWTSLSVGRGLGNWFFREFHDSSV